MKYSPYEVNIYLRLKYLLRALLSQNLVFARISLYRYNEHSRSLYYYGLMQRLKGEIQSQLSVNNNTYETAHSLIGLDIDLSPFSLLVVPGIKKSNVDYHSVEQEAGRAVLKLLDAKIGELTNVGKTNQAAEPTACMQTVNTERR